MSIALTQTHTVRHTHTHSHTHVHTQSHSTTAVGRTRTLITSDYTFINRLQASLLALDLPPPPSSLLSAPLDPFSWRPSLPSKLYWHSVSRIFPAILAKKKKQKKRSSARLDWACDWKSIWSCPLDWKAANYLK